VERDRGGTFAAAVAAAAAAAGEAAADDMITMPSQCLHNATVYVGRCMCCEAFEVNPLTRRAMFEYVPLTVG